MQGLGTIIRANSLVGEKFGGVGANGEGSPWLVVRIKKATSQAAGWFHVVRQYDGKVLAEYQRIKHARKHVARLIREAA
jgi:hypothetical protein